jgi:hypothetical protein
LSEGIDDRVLNRLFRTVVPEDPDLVRLFESVPGFCRSSVINDPRRKITNLGKGKLYMAAMKLLERTWSPKFLPGSEKTRRLVACVDFADAVRLPDVTSSILESIFTRDWHHVLQSVETGNA